MYVSGVLEGGEVDAVHKVAKGSKRVSIHLESATSSANPSG